MRSAVVPFIAGALLVLGFVLPPDGPFWSLTQLPFALRNCPGSFLWCLGWLLVGGAAIPLLAGRRAARFALPGSLAAFAAGAWVLRDRNHLLGDSALWIRSAAHGGWGLHTYREPLSAWISGGAVELLGGIAGPEPVLAALAIASGVMVAWCAATLFRAGAPRDATGLPRKAAGVPRAAALALLIAQPLAFVFFGYTETSPLFLAFLSLALVCLRRDLVEGRVRILSVGLLLGAALAHVFGILVAACLLVVWWLPDRLRRWWPAAPAVILAGVAVGSAMVPSLRPHTVAAQSWSPGHFARYLLDIGNGWLVLALSPGLVLLLDGENRPEEARFRRLLVLLLICFLGLPLVAYFELGLYRDLDLLGPAMLCLLFLGASRGRSVSPRGRLRVAIPAGLVLLAAWLALGQAPAGAARLAALLPESPGTVEARSYGFEILSAWHKDHGDAPGAERMLDDALAATPGNARLWGMKGDLQLARGDTATAMASLERGLRSNRWAEVAGRLGELLVRRGRARQAINLLESDRPAALRESGSAAALAAAYYVAGMPESTVAVADQRLALAPEDDVAWFDRGVGLAALERVPEAIEALQQAIALAPGKKTYVAQLRALEAMAEGAR